MVGDVFYGTALIFFQTRSYRIFFLFLRPGGLVAIEYDSMKPVEELQYSYNGFVW